MASRQLRRAEEILPILIGPETPSPVPAFTEPKRSITPRGPLFPSLGEAHRNITSRIATDGPFRKPSADSQPCTDVPLQEQLIPTEMNVSDNVGPPETLRRHASDLAAPLTSLSMAGRSLTDRQSIAKLYKSATVTNTKLRPSVDGQEGRDVAIDVPQYSNITSSTVGRIGDQYSVTGRDQVSSSPGSPELSYTFEPPPRPWGTTARLGFHKGEDRRVVSKSDIDSHQNNAHPRQDQAPSDTSSAIEPADRASPFASTISEHDWLRGNGLRKLHPHANYQPSLGPRAPNCVPSGDSNTNWVTEPEADPPVAAEDFLESTRSLVPSPLRILPRGDPRTPLDVHIVPFSRDEEMSQGSVLEGASTDSIDDPFRYDNNQYKKIRQLGKEREISRALQQLQEVETHPNGITIAVSPETSPQRIGKPADHDQQSSSDAGSSRQSRYRVDGSFFDADAFRALTGDSPHNHGTGVKVVIHKSSKPGLHKADNENRSAFGLSFEHLNGRSERSLCGRANDGDWVTEATSEADLGIAPSNSELGHGIKTTGSSIADYSEDGFITPFTRFGSRDPILQRPTDPYEDPTSFEMHGMKDKKQNGPTSRFHGFKSNNQQPKPNLPRSMNNQNGALNPFRRDYTRADANSYFAFKADRHNRSRFEFRDSTSTCAQGFESNQAVVGTRATLPSTSMSSITDADLRSVEQNPFTVSGEEISSHDNQRHLTQNRNNEQKSHHMDYSTNVAVQDRAAPLMVPQYKRAPVSLTSTSSKFSFPLLQLSEAQELQKVRRASEATSHVASSLGYHRSFNGSSARVDLTPLSRPVAAYMRESSHVRKGSRLSLTFTPPPWGSPKTNGQSHGSSGRALLTLKDTPGPADFTPLDASASRLLSQPKERRNGTPTATRDWFAQDRERKVSGPGICRLPTDRRVRPQTSDRTLQGILDRDLHSMRAAEEQYISYKAKSRRRLFFHAMLTLSILPFFALLVLNGSFDSSLSWFTHGEVYRLTKKQRKLIKMVFITECIMYASLVAAIIAYFVTVNQAHH